jgi:hypothetical protein
MLGEFFKGAALARLSPLPVRDMQEGEFVVLGPSDRRRYAGIHSA